MGCIDTVLFDVDELQAGFTFFFPPKFLNLIEM